VLKVAAEEAARGTEWAQALARLPEGPEGFIKADGGVAVRWASVLGRDVIVKSWRTAGAAAWVKAQLRASRAWRHWRGAETLGRVGVPTAKCLVLARGSGHEWLVMETLPGNTVLEFAAAKPMGARRERAVARGIGIGIARLHAAMMFNRDHKPSNLIVTRLDDDAAEVAVIDCVAIISARGMSPEQPLVRMLASLVIEPIGCGHPPRLALRRRVLREVLRAAWDEGEGQHEPPDAMTFEEWERQSARSLWSMVSDRMAAHGSMTPRVNPLR
jgi:tRNA A-37 threonylcarbamoyl transferase component Bud32